jgi:hypothetical protein
MATLMKGLLTFCLALAFLVGATAQLVPSSMAMAEIDVRADMTGGCTAPDMPRTGHTPNCIDHLGCLAIPALPTSPASLAIAFRWTSVAYHFSATPLSGISVEPELSPPIPAA